MFIAKSYFKNNIIENNFEKMSPNSWFNDETPENSELLPIVIKGKWESTSIRVLSSEIVAEVIGKDGSKIKELRAKTNTIVIILPRSVFKK